MNERIEVTFDLTPEQRVHLAHAVIHGEALTVDVTEAPAVEALLRRIESLTEQRDRADAMASQTHMEVRQGYDRTIADAWRKKLAEVEAERDAAIRGREQLREQLVKAGEAQARLEEQVLRLLAGRECSGCGRWVTGCDEQVEYPWEAELAEIKQSLDESMFLNGCDAFPSLPEAVGALVAHDNAIDAAEADLEAIDAILDGGDFAEFERAQRVLALRQERDALRSPDAEGEVAP